MGKILVVDDQRNMRTTLAMMLRGAGYEVDEAADGDAGTRARRRRAPTTWSSPICAWAATDGIDVLRAVKQAQPMTEVIVMTAYGTIESAVEAMRARRVRLHPEAVHREELLVKVPKALENRQLHGQVQLFASEFRERYKLREHRRPLAGDPRGARRASCKIAPTDATVLITGESGTGKELVARAIHANSKRADRPFVPSTARRSPRRCSRASCSATRGARSPARSTRARACSRRPTAARSSSTRSPRRRLSFQAKLLRAIQEGEIRRVGENKPIHVDVRIIAATNQDLAHGDRREALPAGPLLPAQRRALPSAAAARARARTSRLWSSSSSTSTTGR